MRRAAFRGAKGWRRGELKRLFILTALGGLLPAIGRSDVSSYQYTGYTDIFSDPFAFRPQWSPDGQWIVFDDHERNSNYSTNSYKVYRIHPDGSGLECLTCGRTEVPLNSGGPAVDPTGRYVVFTAEQAGHLPLASGSSATDPGGGIFNDVAVLDLQTQNIYRLYVTGSGVSGQPVGGSLFARFSHSGAEIAWGDYISPGANGNGGNWFGVWRILVADFVTTPQPHLANIRSYSPGPRAEFYELQGWAPDDKSLIVSCITMPGQNDNTLDIALIDLINNRLIQLTPTSGMQGQPAAYEEHASMAPGGDAIAVMSSGFYGVNLNQTFLAWLKTDLWLANYDGTSPQQLTFFNTPGHPEYTGQTVLVSMLGWSPDGTRLVGNVYYEPNAGHPDASSHIMIFHFATPSPSLSGIVSASAFGALRSATPGSYVELYGVNLAGRTNQWGTFFNGDHAPSNVDSVTVTFAGQPGYVTYISPGQVNVQVPANAPNSGTVPVVLTYEGKSTPPLPVQMQPLNPGMLAPPAFNVGGKQYVVAQHGDGSYVGGGNIPGVPTTPAKPGETITFYGIGFGPAIDASGAFLPLAGQVIRSANTLVNQVQFLFGASREPGRITYDGMAPTFTGLYQFNVTIPNDIPNGDVSLVVLLNGSSVPQNLVISVHN